MRHQRWYVLNQTQAIIEFDEEEFKIITEHREDAFEYIQTFDDNNIVEYNTIVINASNDTAKERFHSVYWLYGIIPQEIRIKAWQEDYIFNLAKPLSKAWATRVSKILETLYFAPARYLTFYNPDEANTVSEWYINMTAVNWVWAWIKDINWLPINDVKNKDELLDAQAIPAIDVVTAMKRQDKVDEDLGIVIGYWSPITYVLTILRSVEATYRFYSENFAIAFADTYDSMEEYINDGIFVSGDGIIRAGGRICMINEKWEQKELTDFDITVHYKIRRSNSVAYVVSLKKIDDEVRHIEWPSSFNETKICEFVSSFWAYHITASKSNLNKIHDMIANSKVPDITVYYKYGKWTYWQDDIVIFKDYVYNVTKNVAIPKFWDSGFYFIDGINGIKVEGNNWANIDSMLIDKAPSMWMSVAHEFDTFLAVTKQAFTDISWELILMIATAWLWHSLYWGWLPCPMFFTTWITWSGKTTFAKYVCSLFGIDKPLSIEGTTPFPLRISLTLLNQLPLFLNEFRTKMPGATEKTSILKSLFDGTAFERWRPNLTLESHKFSAYAFMEWEELPDSGATRTRSIIWKVKKTGQWKVIPENLLNKNRELMNSFCYSYFQGSKKELYDAALEEGYEYFFAQWMERRILTNIVILYAGAMAFAPHLSDTFKVVCKELLAIQLEDFNRNGTIAEIINILSKYVGSRYPKVYIDWFHIIIPWNDVIDFVERWRISTELKINWYRDHVEAFWIDVWFFKVSTNTDDLLSIQDEIMVDWLRIPIAWIDQRFLCNKVIFSLYQKYRMATIPK